MSIVTPAWRALADFPGYEISEEGDVRCWTYRGRKLTAPREIIAYLTNSNRWAVKLMKVDETTKKSHRHTMSLAVLVLLTFQGNPGRNETFEVDFKDDNPYNIHSRNLSWRKNLQKFKELT